MSLVTVGKFYGPGSSGGGRTSQYIVQEPQQSSSTYQVLGVAFLSSGQAVCAYCGAEGRCISLPFSGLSITHPLVAPLNAIGIAASSSTGGNNLNVVSIGVTSTSISYTLTIGTKYYWDAPIGRPTSNSIYPYALGIALNTQLLLVARVTGTNQYFG